MLVIAVRNMTCTQLAHDFDPLVGHLPDCPSSGACPTASRKRTPSDCPAPKNGETGRSVLP